MGDRPWERWERALLEYRYVVDLRDFAGRSEYGEQWFSENLASGDREETIHFEDRFRAAANVAIEAWYEVIFWKMASQGRRDYSTASSSRDLLRRMFNLGTSGKRA